MNYKNVTTNIRQELKNYIVENNIKSLVLGISGGIDSAICAALAKPICDELNIPLIGRSLPTTTNSGGENSRAKEIGKHFCTDFKEVNIESGFTAMYGLAIDNFHIEQDGITDKKESILRGNVKARTRMILLYDIAGATDGMVLSTDNWTEYLLGFWTLHGDVGDYGMIQELWKTEVYNLAEWLANELSSDAYLLKVPDDNANALHDCIDCQATDGLGISNSDLDQIMPGWTGTSRDGYKIVDDKLMDYYHTHNGDISDPVISRYLRTEFKRKNPVNIKRTKIDG